jgi:hypothetical protein
VPLFGCVATMGTTVEVWLEWMVDTYYNGRASLGEVAPVFVLNTVP